MLCLQARDLLTQYLWQEVHPLLTKGTEYAMSVLQDPALALLHLLHCMYVDLMVGSLWLQLHCCALAALHVATTA